MPEQVQPIAGWNGFIAPNYTPVPDDFFDVLLAELTDVEVRVLLYMMRRTFGFKKQHDDISLNQIIDGITKQNGEVLDRGAGVSRKGAMLGISRLEARGVISVQRNKAANGALLASTYTLRMAGDPSNQRRLGQGTTETRASNHGALALVNDGNQQETPVQETEIQEGITPDVSESDAPPPYSAYIAGVVQDIAADLHSANPAAEVGPALRLWARLAVPEAEFVERLAAARAAKPGPRTMAQLLSYIEY